MNAQATPSPYTPAGGSNMTLGNPPVLGGQVPGSTGGLPALGGLAVTQNPLAPELQSQPQMAAQHAQQFGRGEDTMLVHMTPAEVNSLQGLAMASGGSLTINPHTGLPEAGWLGKLLPTLLGFGLNFIPGIGPLAAAGITAAGATAVTGDLKKGLMAGLQAYGGAGLSGALAPGATAGAAAKLGTEAAAKMAAEKAAVATAQQGLTAAGSDVAAKAVAQKALDEALKNQVTKMPGLLGRFGAETSLGAKGLIGKALPAVAGSAVLGAVSDATAPKLPTYKPEETKPYVRMAPAKREVRYPTPEELQQLGSAEFNYFTPSNPEPVPDTQAGAGYGFADGGEVENSAPVSSEAALNALISSYQAASPGAITASMRPNPLPAYVKPADTTAAATTTTPAPASTPAVGASNNWVNNLTPPTPAPDSSGNWWYGDLDMGGGPQWYIAPERAAAVKQASAAASGTPTGGMSPTAPASTIGSYTTTASETGGEPMYNFSRTPIGSSTGSSGLSGLTGLNFGGIDWSKFLNNSAATPTTPAPAAMDINPGNYGQQDIYNSPYNYGQSDMYDNLSMYARGGGVNMRDGAFVVDARTVSELGNGSSNAGMELLSRMGGKPVRGPGDGVSDSVPASIGGKQKARVARDEVIFQPEAVRRLGNGDAKRGTQKLYALMDRAHKARKKAKRGQDTGLRKGLA